MADIVRWFDNDEAKKYLGQFNLDFSRAFARATPFGGENNYKYYATEQSSSRKHLFEAKMPEMGSSVSFQNFKGDYLKTKILNEFQKKIKKITTKTELDAFRGSLPENPEYKVLATGQGLTTRLLGLKTSSIAALNEMLDKKGIELNVEPPPNKPSKC